MYEHFKRYLVLIGFFFFFMSPLSVQAQSSYFFYSISDDPWTLVRRDSNGSVPTTLYTPPIDQVNSSAADRSIDKLYYYDSNIGSSVKKIYQSDYDGLNQTTLVTPTGNISSLAAGNGYLYYSYGATPWSIRRINSGGGGDTEIYVNPSYGIVQHVAFDSTNNYLYFYEYQYDDTNNRIVRTDVDGNNDFVVYNNIPTITCLAAEGGYVYFAFSGTPWTFTRRNYDGTGEVTVYTPPTGQVRDCAVDILINKMYFYHSDTTNVIYQADLDGTNLTAGDLTAVVNPVDPVISLSAASTTPSATATVTTQAVTGIATTTATGNGNITNLGVSNPTAHGVCWNTGGTPTTAGSYTDEGAAGATGAFTSNITSLSANTTYYVRAYATNSAGTSYGGEVSFKTLAVAPTVTTQAVTGETATTATGNGNITNLGVPNPTAHGVCWNTGGSPTTANSCSNEGAAGATGAFTSNLTVLSANTTYYVRAYATNTAGTSYGGEVSFTTLPVAATVTTQAVTGKTSTTATGNGNITNLGAPNPTAHGVCWNTGGSPTTAESYTDEGAAGTTGAFISSITSLSPNTTYYVRAYATNTAGTSYGSEVSFTTLPVAPTVTTQAVTGKTSTTAIGNGNITNLGVPNPTAHGVCWNTGGSPTTGDSYTDEGAAGATDAFTSNITSLSANTTYYVRAYATNSAGTSYGGEVSFTTLPVAPTVTTQAVTGETSTTATGNGNITNLGAPNPTAHGVCWNTGGSPTTGDSYTDEGAAGATSAFTSNITLLSANTTYYVRAYATNTAGTSYGAEVSFTTLPVAPTVTTQVVTGETSTTATGNGNITNLGAPNPTAHGVCWNTGGSPTTGDSYTDEGATGATGAFTSSITSLSANTTYYVRAYATNTAGISYGGEVSFTTLPVAATVTTQTVTTIATSTATGNGDITNLGVPNPTAHGVCWNTGGSPTTGDSYTDEGAVAATGAFTSNLTSLSPNTTYYTRAYATNTAGTSYGGEVFFTTLPVAPTVTTQTVINIATTTATGNGNITNLGVPNPTVHGVCWNTGGSPTTANSYTDEGAATATGAFTSNLTSLNPNTTYYVRTYATNTAGTSYGGEVSFTTLPAATTITTQAVTNIASTTATGNGNITSLGAPNPTAHGVCWNTLGNPTTADSCTDEGPALSMGDFSSPITSLSPYTTYYVRSYATNMAGTSYGNPVSFISVETWTLSIIKEGIGSGTVTSFPGGIDCGTDCEELWEDSTSITLVATPELPSKFVGWSGDDDCADGTVNMTRDVQCTANFHFGFPWQVLQPALNFNGANSLP